MINLSWGCLELVFESFVTSSENYWVSIKTPSGVLAKVDWITVDIISSTGRTINQVAQDYIAALDNNDADKRLPALKYFISKHCKDC